MVLLIEKQKYENSCSLDDLRNHKKLIEESQRFASSREIQQPENEIAKTIYIHQNEFGVIAEHDENDFQFIGSDEATTCHILVLDNHTAVALAHLDGSETRKSIELMLHELARYASDNTNYDVYCVGGFVDEAEHDYSRGLSNEILEILSSMPNIFFHLRLAAITPYNDHIIDEIHYPLIYGICFEIKSKVIRKMSFIDHGPAFRLRSAYLSAYRHPSFCLYSSLNRTITLKRFEIKHSSVVEYYRPLHQFCFRNDEMLLKMTSTSPKQEKPSYLINMKKQILYILTYEKQIPTWFDEQTQSIVFSRSGDKWITDNKKLVDDVQL